MFPFSKGVDWKKVEKREISRTGGARTQAFGAKLKKTKLAVVVQSQEEENARSKRRPSIEVSRRGTNRRSNEVARLGEVERLVVLVRRESGGGFAR